MKIEREITVDKLLNRKIDPTSIIYGGTGIIKNAFFIYDELYHENRLKVIIQFPKVEKARFDLLTAVEKGTLTFSIDASEIKQLEKEATDVYSAVDKKPQKDKTSLEDIEVHLSQEADLSREADRFFNNFYDESAAFIISDLRNEEKTLPDTCYPHFSDLSLRHSMAKTVYDHNTAHVPELLNVMRVNGFRCFHHHTDFSNFIDIFQSGILYSRTSAPDFFNSASQSVMAHTSNYIQDYVRFYFRPLTPTFFNNEGIFKGEPLPNMGNTPIPVALLFPDNILYTKGALITDGNAGTNATKITPFYTTAINYDWDAIFSTGPYSNAITDFTRKRCAEFLIPNKIDLKHLEKICFRTAADMKHAVTLFGNDPRFTVDPSMFNDRKGEDRNYLLDYDFTYKINIIELHLKFLNPPFDYKHKLDIALENGCGLIESLDQLSDFENTEVTLSINTSVYAAPIKEIKYLLNDNVCAIWRNK